MKKNKKNNNKVVRKTDAYKEAEKVVNEAESLSKDLMGVMGLHAKGEHPTLVALMGLASVVAEILQMQESVGVEDPKGKFLFLLASEITLRNI